MSIPNLRVIRIGAVVLLALSIVGCGTAEKRAASQESATKFNKKVGVDESQRLQKFIEERKSSSSLSLPPDLLASSNAAIVKGYEESQKSAGQEVLPEVVGARIVDDNNTRHLEVETQAKEVWKRLVNYWASEQVSLTTFKPAAGLMETEWIANAKPSSGAKGMARALFNRVIGQGVSHDRYAIRLEKVSDNVTKVYVSHRATVKKELKGQSPKKVGNFDWVQVEDNPEKVAELMQLIILLFDTSSTGAA